VEEIRPRQAALVWGTQGSRGRAYLGHPPGGVIGRYVEIVNGKPRWVSNAPKEPCFVMQGNKWVRIPCNR